MYSDYISGIKNATLPPTIQVAGGITIPFILISQSFES